LGQGEGKGAGAGPDADPTELAPIWKLPFLRAYRGTPLDTPAWWHKLCPQDLPHRATFFAKLAAEVQAAPFFQGRPPHAQAAVCAIRDHADRIAFVMHLRPYVVKPPGEETHNGHHGGDAHGEEVT
jgi:hypothetical protein